MTVRTLEYGANVQKIIEVLEADGAAILSNAVPPHMIAELNTQTQSLLSDTANCNGIFHGYSTKRVGGMVGKSKICQDLALNPSVLSVMDHFLLPHCTDYQLNLSQLISIEPGESQQVVHADDPMFPFQHPGTTLMINVMWAIDDFTTENGATHVALGSHKWPDERLPLESELKQGEMTAGSCMIWLGSARHGGGANRSLQPRRGIVISYCLGWLRQSENQYLAIPQEIARTFPEALQKLVGYFVHKPNLGMVDGADPIKLLSQKAETSSGFRDFLPEHVTQLLEYQTEHSDVVAGCAFH